MTVILAGNLQISLRRWRGCLAGVGLVFGLSLPAGAAPCQLALCYPLQVVEASADVTGLRLNLLYGRNQDIAGLDVGLINQAVHRVVGLQIGGIGNLNTWPFSTNQAAEVNGLQAGLLFNTTATARGAQVGAGVNWVQGDLRGLQLCYVANVVQHEARGVQAGWLNVAQQGLTGLQLGGGLLTALNFSGPVRGAQVNAGLFSFNEAAEITGAQINVGLIGNHAREVCGAQIAVMVNLATQVHGVQIGLVNYCDHLQGVQVGLVNISRHSPWPVCPIVNVGF